MKSPQASFLFLSVLAVFLEISKYCSAISALDLLTQVLAKQEQYLIKMQSFLYRKHPRQARSCGIVAPQKIVLPPKRNSAILAGDHKDFNAKIKA